MSPATDPGTAGSMASEIGTRSSPAGAIGKKAAWPNSDLRRPARTAPHQLPNAPARPKRASRRGSIRRSGSQVIARIALPAFIGTPPIASMAHCYLGSVGSVGSRHSIGLRHRDGACNARVCDRPCLHRSLGRRMTKPVMPDDESFEYLATQAIANFLATENEPSLDGIIFQSAQSEEGRNVVLFHKAARVELMQFAPGTELKVPNGYTSDDGAGGLITRFGRHFPSSLCQSQLHLRNGRNSNRGLYRNPY